MLDSLAHASGKGLSASEISGVLRELEPRWFMLRDVHSDTALTLLEPRWALSSPRGR